MSNNNLINPAFLNSKSQTYTPKIISLPHIEIISKESEFFPKNLLVLPDCPDILFVIGNKNILNNLSVSIIGTRNSSPLGNEIAYNFSKELSSNNIIIVSGMASGIDTQAHLGGQTIAIIACGFNHIFKRKNIQLINNILNSGGAIISEYFPDTPPQKYTFLNRNRLVAAISSATIVIEAPLESGAINTSQIAFNLGKSVFAIPWNIFLKRGEGCNALIANNAKILLSTKQIIDFFSLNKWFTLNRQNIFSNSEFNSSSKTYNTSPTGSPSTTPHIPKEFIEFYKYIKQNEPVNKNNIYAAFKHISISSINSKLVLMELQSFIKLKRK